MKNVLSKLQQARTKLHSMQLKKSGHNKFAGYSYFELGDFLMPTMQIFTELHLSSLVSFGAEMAELSIVDLDSGESVKITSPMSSAALKGCHEVQNLGAVQSYLRRYLWVAAMEIVEHDAIDSSEPVKEKKAITPVKAAMQSVSVNDEDMEFLKQVAVDLVQYVEVDNDPVKALEHLEAQMLDNEQKIALWDILQPNSKTRNKIKSAKVARETALKGMAA